MSLLRSTSSAHETQKDSPNIKTQLFDTITTLLNKQRGHANLADRISDSRISLRGNQEPGDGIVLVSINAERDKDVVWLEGDDMVLDQLVEGLDIVVVGGCLGQGDVDVEAESFAFTLFEF